MKIVLINSSIRETLSYGIEDGFPEGLDELIGTYPPLGICYLASVLRENGFNDITLIDAEIERDLESVISSTLKENPDIIGISAMTFSFLYALKLAKKLKEKTDVPIVVGGPHVDFYPMEVMSHKCFDIGVIGEGEYTFLDIVKLLRKNKKEDFIRKLGKIDGIVFRRGNKIIRTRERPFIKNLDEIPFPARDLLDIKKYHHTYLSNPFVSMITSRGCPYRCSFCSRTKWNLVWRAHSPEYVVSEIKHCIDKFGITSFQFFDDTFTVSKERVLKISNLIRKEKLKVKIVCLSRVDTVDREVLRAMKQAGVETISFGFESGDEDVLKAMNKGTTIKQAKKAVALCREVGIDSIGYFIVGYPSETKKSILNTIKFIKEARPSWFKANLFVPYPGSTIYEKLIREGKIVDFWRKMTIEGKPYTPPKVNENLSIEELRKWISIINSMVYLGEKSNLLHIHKIKTIDFKANLKWIKNTIINRLKYSW